MQHRYLSPLGQFAILVFFLLAANPAQAQQPRISGYVFGDAYVVAAHDDADGVEEADQIQGQNGLWFRRMYLTFDFPLSDTWRTRIRTEMGSPGDFSTRARLVPFAKDLYVQWRNDRHRVTFGLSGTPTWATVEDVWGYRSVEKTLLDLQRIGSSRDIGIAAQGSLDPDEKIFYNVMISNGGGTSSENNKGKKILAAVGVRPSDGLVLEAYTDFEERPGEANRFTIQGFAGIEREKGRAGLQYVHQTRETPGGPDIEVSGLSVFGVVQLEENLHGFARFDKMFDLNPDAGRISYLPFHDTAKSNMLLFGIDFQPIEQIHFMPNAEIVFYDENSGFKPGATVMPRMTFFVTFG